MLLILQKLSAQNLNIPSLIKPEKHSLLRSKRVFSSLRLIMLIRTLIFCWVWFTFLRSSHFPCLTLCQNNDKTKPHNARCSTQHVVSCSNLSGIQKTATVSKIKCARDVTAQFVSPIPATLAVCSHYAMSHYYLLGVLTQQ